MPLRPESFDALARDDQRKAAAQAFNLTWTLLEKDGRTREEDDLMMHSAHASRFLWDAIGTPVNRTRGEWQVSRVYSVLGRGEPALFHGRRCLELCEEHGARDFDLAFAYEALARAHQVAGDADESARYLELARGAVEEIADEEDKQHVLDDLATIG